MSGSESNGRKSASHNGHIEISSLVCLLNEQDEAMQALFAKALNLYLSPGADEATDSEKIDRLKKAIEDSLR